MSGSKGITYATTYGVITINNNIKLFKSQIGESQPRRSQRVGGVFHAIDVTKEVLYKKE